MLGEVECPDLTAFFQVSHDEKMVKAKDIDPSAGFHCQSQQARKRDHVDLLSVLYHQWALPTDQYSAECSVEHQRTL